jgi:hypothetical protein
MGLRARSFEHDGERVYTIKGWGDHPNSPSLTDVTWPERS